MNSISDTENIVRITADAKKFDSPSDADTGSTVKFRQFDGVRVDVVFRINGALADLSKAAYAELEIADIGTLNAPEPRTARVLARKRVEASELNVSIGEDAILSGASHASFLLKREETSMDAGEKWMRIYVVDSEGSRTSFANGWVFVEPTYGEDANVVPPDDYRFVLKARETALMSEGYALGEQDGIGVGSDSVYFEKNSRYFAQSAEENAKNVHLFSESAQSYAKSAEEYSKKAGSYSSESSSNATLARNYSKSAGESASEAAELLASVSQIADPSGILPLVQKQLHRMENVGFFELEHGSMESEEFVSPTCFSFCITVSEDYTGRLFKKGRLELSINSDRKVVLSDGIDEEQSSNPLPLAETAIVLIANRESVSVLANGKTYIEGFIFMPDGLSNRLYIGSDDTVGRLSRIKMFNFDMSDGRFPYCADDYFASLDENPRLNCQPSNSDHRYFAKLNRGEISEDGRTFSFSNITTQTAVYVRNTNEPENYSPSYFKNFGGKFHIRVRIHVDAVSSVMIQYYTNGDMNSLEGMDYVVTDTSDSTVESGYMSASTAGVIYFGSLLNPGREMVLDMVFRQKEELFFEGDIDSFFRFTVSSTEGVSGYFALDDFSFASSEISLPDSSELFQISDNSYNNRNFTLKGNAFSQKESNPALCRESFSWASTASTQAFFNGKELPKNCFVEIYARPSADGEFSYQLNGMETSADLVAGEMKMVGSFATNGDSQLLVCPTGIYAGTLESFVSVKRF